MSADEALLVSVPITNHRIAMRDLRDFVEATSGASENSNAEVIVGWTDGELRWEGVR